MMPYFIALLFSVPLAIAAFVLWESVDAAYWWISKNYNFKSNLMDTLFDKRGVSWGDLLVGALGVLAAMKQSGVI